MDCVRAPHPKEGTRQGAQKQRDGLASSLLLLAARSGNPIRCSMSDGAMVACVVRGLALVRDGEVLHWHFGWWLSGVEEATAPGPAQQRVVEGKGGLGIFYRVVMLLHTATWPCVSDQ